MDSIGDRMNVAQQQAGASLQPDLFGSVYQAADDGLGYIAEEGTGNLYSFTLDCIADYRGETTAELSLTAGRRVRFRVGSNARIFRVWL